MMMEQGMRPRLTTYNNLLSACAASSAVERALEVFSEMKAIARETGPHLRHVSLLASEPRAGVTC